VGEPSRVGTPQWMELRAAAIERARGRCEACHTPSSMLCLKALSVKSIPLQLENVQAVCAGCLRGEAPKKFAGRKRQLVFSRSKR
jgi:hypothetical protein